MQLRTLLPLAMMLFTLLLGGCATAGAPAAAPAAEAPAEESAATEEAAAPAPAETVGDAVEAPPVNPVDTAPEATAQPALAATFVVIPELSRAEYAVEEEFLGAPVPFVTTVGGTNAIEGEVTLDMADGAVRMGDNRFTVDLRTIQSDEPRRDARLRTSWLESDRFPWPNSWQPKSWGCPPTHRWAKKLASRCAAT